MSEIPASATSAVPGPTVDEPEFTWRFTHKLDTQARVQMPADWRPNDPNFVFMLCIWPHQPSGRKKACIKGFTQRVYRDLVRKVDAMRLGDPEADALRRALEVGLGKEAYFMGLGTQFEIWNKETLDDCRKTDSALSTNAFSRI
jgi:DNA-binding transcriptional regulator/RsmH inhibitor MraZ